MMSQTSEHRTGGQAASNIASSKRLARGSSAAIALLAIIFLFFAASWLMDLEQTLPNVRAPRDTTNSETLPGHAMMQPGFHDVDQIDAELTGEWLMQEVGERDWLATDQPANQFRAVFYGTDVYLRARVGPEAGLVYVTIDGEPVGGLPEDENGSYIDLWAVQAADLPILLASGLAHGEHLVELTSGPEGEVAISGIEVVAETPFPWAFVLAYTGIAAGLFAAVRQLLLSLGPRTPYDESTGTTTGGAATDS